MDPPADQVMSSHNEFSTNQHSEKLLAGDATDVIGQALTAIPNAVLDANNNLTRHPNLSFDDGNFAIVTGDFYFLVHRGLLCRHSAVLTAASEELLTNVIPNTSQRFELEGRPALRLQDSPDDMSNFLLALYDGVCVDVSPLTLSSTLDTCCIQIINILRSHYLPRHLWTPSPTS